jgi:hypothetical protein
MVDDRSYVKHTLNTLSKSFLRLILIDGDDDPIRLSIPCLKAVLVDVGDDERVFARDHLKDSIEYLKRWNIIKEDGEDSVLLHPRNLRLKLDFHGIGLNERRSAGKYFAISTREEVIRGDENFKSMEELMYRLRLELAKKIMGDIMSIGDDELLYSVGARVYVSNHPITDMGAEGVERYA